MSGWRSVVLGAMLVSGTASPARSQQGAADSALVSIEQIRSPRLSSDGRRVAFERVTTDDNGVWRPSIWVVGTDGRDLRELGPGARPQWSPDGQTVAYLVSGPLNGGVAVRSAAGGDERIVATGPIDAVRWSPDGREIAFAMRLADSLSWADGSTMRITRRMRTGGGPGTATQILVVTVDGGTARRVTPPGFDARSSDTGSPDAVPFDWIDGGTLVVAGTDSALTDGYQISQLYRLDISSRVVRRITTHPGFWHSPTVSPDRKMIAYLGFPETRASYRTQDLFVMRADGAAPRLLSVGFDRDVFGVRWADKDDLWFSAQERGTVNTFTVSTRGGRVKPGSNGSHRMVLGDVSGRGNVGVAVRSTPTRPDEIVRFQLGKAWELTPVTNINAALADRLPTGETEEFEYRSADGTLVHGWLSRPATFDPANPPPAVIMLHDGPHAMSDAGFDAAVARLTMLGFVVYRPNVRGSTGYGTDHGNRLVTFPAQDVDDVIAGADELVRGGIADSTQIFLRGCGGGAVVALATIERTTRFGGAVLECGWDFLAPTSRALPATDVFSRPFRADAAQWLATSPLRDVGRIRTPVLQLIETPAALTPADQRAAFHRELLLRSVPAVWAEAPATPGASAWLEVEKLVGRWLNGR